MTRDHARKLGAADDPAAAGAVIIARVSSTLASPGARIERRADWGSRWGLGRPAGHRPGRAERLATFAAQAVVKRISPETDLASMRDELTGAFLHPAGEGFIEPAGDRYQLDYAGSP